MKISTYLSAAALTLVGFSAAAQMPKVEFPIDGSNVIINRISDNGKWGVSESGSVTEGDLRPIGGYVYNMETYEQIPVRHSSGLAGVSDITNDGKIVVGECDGAPAYWNKDTDTWTKVELPEGYDLGRFNAVTPDGKYAAGYFTSSVDIYKAKAMAYDLTTGKALDLSGLPTLDKSHLDRGMNALYDISPDGRYIVGMLSQSYMMDTINDIVYAPLCAYVYDIKEGTYDMIGYQDDPVNDWTPDVENLWFVASPSMSNNGEWITGMAYMVTPIPGSEWPNEAYHVFRYNVKTKAFEVYADDVDADIAGFSISNDGVVYGATPAENPYATCVVRSGDYFITLDQIFSQVYGYDFFGLSGKAVTGKPTSISDDGRTLIMLPDTEGSYVLKLPESLAESAKRVKLLGSYSVTPAEGVMLSRLTSITLNFDRNVKVHGNSSKVTFASTDGTEKYNPVSTNGITADGKKVTITFRSRDLTGGKEYELTIPEGIIYLEGNDKEVNEEIKIKYLGRANTPVQVVEIMPGDDAWVNMLDVNSNPILINFDAQIQLVEGGRAELYRNDETTPFCALNIGINGTYAILFPTAGQYLYEGSDYRVVVPANTLTDISGGGGNEEITFTYHGSYERTAPEGYIYYEDCTDYTRSMFYEGDHRQPDLEVASWGFTADTTPWFIVRDEYDETMNMAFASHSMYTPKGKSNDWFITPQLYIPDEKCFLKFLAQNYLEGYDDVLDIYVYPCGDVYNTPTEAFVNDMLTKGDNIFHEVLNPGPSEGLVDEWTSYELDLAKYAGQEIYIGFANLNDNQSAIFIDDIIVNHDTETTVEFDTPARVVKQESVPVSGVLFIQSELDTYNNIKLVLTDAEGTKIDTIEDKGLNLSKGSQYEFKFDRELPLKIGEINTYYVEMTLDEEPMMKLAGKVTDLAFQPNRRIVLEEYTGSECGNCPLGIRAMENIEMLYPNVLLPITIRTYQSDRLGLTMGAYSQALGLDAMGAPSAVIDRREYVYPMINVDGDYRFTGAGIPHSSGQGEERVWLDAFRTQYESPAEVGIHIKSELKEDNSKIDVKLHIENAVNKYRAAYKVFAVITEDGLTTYQKNYMGTVTDPDLGEWGAGGKYSTPLVANVEAHGVARQTWGTTYQGTVGLFPSVMKAGWGYETEFSIDIPSIVENVDNCNLIVMILDETDRVLNANVCKLDGESHDVAVDTIGADTNAIQGMAVIDGKLYVNAEGKFALTAYDMAGAAILSAEGDGYTSLPLHGYKGVLIVKAVDAQGNAKSAKFFVR
ncbi:MAG: Ig-like domain-containing protein [Muribaculaceae bacterium]|nr:Ig-like domain-containing protein [Muribaculaceae bacterium]